ncbi:MAG: hypothetical protein HN356_14145 [Calditrichaeota bacterium]|jgi:hypothetical protein|nr:hypothetical protein [Calditrichota bacterium]MBT7617867.1 hypothetical protein [Calditrichota bacterium]
MKLTSILTIIIILLLSSVQSVWGRDDCKVEFEPVQDTFLYGMVPALRFRITNFSNEKISLLGLSGDKITIFDVEINKRPELDNWHTEGVISVDALETISLEYSLSGSRPYIGEIDLENFVFPEDDSPYRFFYPLGKFKVYAPFKINKGKDSDWDSYISCEFEVQIPTGHDKVVFDSLVTARLLGRNFSDYEANKAQAREIYRKLLRDNPDSPYRHVLIFSVINGYQIELGLQESLPKRVELANWYLDNSSEYFPKPLRHTMGVVITYYKSQNDKSGLIRRFRKLANKADETSFARYKLERKINSIEAMSADKFKVNY